MRRGCSPSCSTGGYLGVVDVTGIEQAPAGSCAGELADRTAPVVAPDDDLEGDIPELAAARGHAVAVVDGGRVVGLLRLDEVNRLVTKPGNAEER